MGNSVDVVIPIYKAGNDFVKMLEKLYKQSKRPEHIYLLQTIESKDEKLFDKEKCSHGLANIISVHPIKKSDFDHGATRAYGALMAKSEYVLFMTQDAVPADEYLVENLAAAFESPDIDAAYARQLPAADCALIERYTRSFNYPDTPSVKTKADLPKYGIKTFFCSNVCAMYRASTYQKLGGFEKKTIFNEDMIFAGKIILNGGSIAYVPAARVIHSHNYGNLEQLRRNFDLAVSQAEHPEIFALASSESEGMKLVKQTAEYLVKSGHPWLLPELVVKSGFKFIGYRLGKEYRKLPESLVKRLSMNKSYWEK